MDSSVPRDEESPLLVANQLSDEAHRKHSRDVHILSCGFLLIFLAYGAAQNLESSVNTVTSIVVPNLTLLHGTYLTSTAWSYSKVSNLHEGTVIGSFNGEFWGMVASHQFIGNLISLAILQDDGGGSTSGTTLLFVLFLCSMTLGTVLLAEFTKDVVAPVLGVHGVGGSMAAMGLLMQL
ncbi:hypothetical protein CDL15_Pgr020583 [Punica granatum]|uniref:Uncharacterized protein n=1 Tax=Punica granatum TaxID=22663 RepID=A0A218VW50_PUNGR|nr:hypothetical protein CDL15_Pgr020583 [Punica granatum]